jgi:hypothetical protein
MAKTTDKVEDWRLDGTYQDKLNLITSLSMQGLSKAQIGEHEEINISPRQITRLCKKHKEFAAAFKKGREYVVAFAQNALMNQVKNGNVTAIIYALKVYGGQFFKENKIELDLAKAEFEFKKQQAAAGNKEEERTIVFNIKPATGLDVEQEH